MNPEQIAWESKPPTPLPYQSWRYEPLPPGAHLTGVVATTVVGVWTHWAGQTVPCLGAACKLGPRCPQERRWTGYVGLALAGGARRIVLLPASTAHQAAEMLVVGAVVKVSRKASRSPVRVELVREQVDESFPAEDLRPALQWMWRRCLGASGSIDGSDTLASVPQTASQHGDSHAPAQPAAAVGKPGVLGRLLGHRR